MLLAALHGLFPSEEGMFITLGIAGILAWAIGAAATAGMLRVAPDGSARKRFYAVVVGLAVLIATVTYAGFDGDPAAAVIALIPCLGLIGAVVYMLELQSPPGSRRNNAIIGGCVVSVAGIVAIIVAFSMAFG